MVQRQPFNRLEELLNEIAERGVSLRLEDGEVKIKGVSRLTADELAELRSYRQEILENLSPSTPKKSESVIVHRTITGRVDYSSTYDTSADSSSDPTPEKSTQRARVDTSHEEMSDRDIMLGRAQFYARVTGEPINYGAVREAIYTTRLNRRLLDRS